MKKIFFLLLTISLFNVCSFSQSRYVSETTKMVVFARDGGICQCCGGSDNLEFDHITPFSCGGESAVSNIQLLCQKCNRSKSNSCYCKVHNKKVGTNCCAGQTTNNRSNTSVQCSGITLQGLRCRKMTRSSSGRCHLHEGQTTRNRTPGTTRSPASTSRQCSGITQKGLRCRNRTRNANGRCHLH